MQIQTNYQINFEQKYKTRSILQITTGHILEPNGMEEHIKTIRSFYENFPKYTGSGGYKKYSSELASKILPKYPSIRTSTEEINKILENKKFIRTDEIKKEITPIIEKIGEEIDIVI
jgi:hypothetical protein